MRIIWCYVQVQLALHRLARLVDLAVAVQDNYTPESVYTFCILKLALTYFHNLPCQDLNPVAGPHKECCATLKSDGDHEVTDEGARHEHHHDGGDDEDAEGLVELVHQLVRGEVPPHLIIQYIKFHNYIIMHNNNNISSIYIFSSRLSL